MQDMLKKGFEKELIEQTLDGMDFDEKEQIEAFIKKKCPDIASINHEQKAKLVASLMRRGYSYDDIREVIKDEMNFWFIKNDIAVMLDLEHNNYKIELVH